MLTTREISFHHRKMPWRFRYLETFSWKIFLYVVTSCRKSPVLLYSGNAVSPHWSHVCGCSHPATLMELVQWLAREQLSLSSSAWYLHGIMNSSSSCIVNAFSLYIWLKGLQESFKYDCERLPYWYVKSFPTCLHFAPCVFNVSVEIHSL